MAEALTQELKQLLGDIGYGSEMVLMAALQPVLEAQVMIDHGMTSNQAASVHGS